MTMKNFMLLAALLLFAGTQAHAQTQGNASQESEATVKLKITGMTCGGCASHVSTALGKAEGVIKEEVKFPGDVAIVTYDPAKTSEEKIIAIIVATGYKAEVLKGSKEACSPDCTKSCCAKN